MLTLILASFLFGSSLSEIFTKSIISKFGLNFFSSQFSSSIPAFSSQLAVVKTDDLINFGMTIFLSLCIFLLNSFNLKKETTYKNNLLNIGFLLFAVSMFLQTHFVRFSGKEAIACFILIQVLFLVFKKLLPKSLGFRGWLVSANGFLIGFYLVLFVRFFTTSFLINIGVILATVIFYNILGFSKFAWIVRNPSHLLLIISIFFPWNRFILIILGIASCVSILVNKCPKFVEKNLSLIYSSVFIFYLSYNPLFYYGNLDSVEEGFWLGWLERLLNGQILYLDVAVFHPPLIAWGMGLFVKIFGTSVYFVRLYLHILELAGIMIFFALSLKLLQKKLNIVMLLILMIAYLSTLVKNNVEIRVGLGLLAILFLFNYLSKKAFKWLFLSGIFTAISFFTSIESGLAAFSACLIGLVTNRQTFSDFIKKFSLWVAGVSLISGLIIGILLFQNSLLNAISQLSFYAMAFSSGYFNSPMPTPEIQNMLQWWRVDKFLGSDAMIWTIAMFALSAVYMYLIAIFRKGTFMLKDKLLLMLVVYSTIISRVILAKSDWYHLLFLLLPIILSFIYVIESLEKMENLKYVSITVWIFFMLVFSRDIVSQVFINNQLFKLISYSNISQRFNIYQTPRAKIAVDIDAPVSDTDQLIDFIQNNTSTSDKIFAFPWKPEIYFLADRQNATKFDTPYSFFTPDYQDQMVSQIVANKPKYIIYNPDMNFANLSSNSLPKVQTYIVENYVVVENFGKEKVMAAK
ncbi:hypothetical protein A2769_02710 [Candidatus Daviesbacteria bacterium RIFCSPHIGHO2_01_FULL_37_27]|nr:MAG: hypothetical protein A2769_02710 [Candidatus Daviesbacteria bacterium RIFCSPHIGHO2_01_FULL_37_27]